MLLESVLVALSHIVPSLVITVAFFQPSASSMGRCIVFKHLGEAAAVLVAPAHSRR
eukprot:jgi/Phyca11/506403/fgenesh2_kg.PHYCAscaffold_19_\